MTRYLENTLCERRQVQNAKIFGGPEKKTLFEFLKINFFGDIIMYKLLKNTVRWSWPAGLGLQPTGRTQVRTAIFKTVPFGHIGCSLRGELKICGFLTKKSRFSTLNSAKAPGIDRKCFQGALGTCAMRCRAFARSLVV